METIATPRAVTFALAMSPDPKLLAAHSDQPVGLETPQACLARAVEGIAGARQIPPEYLRWEGDEERTRYFVCTRVGIEFSQPLPEAVAKAVLDRAGADFRSEGYRAECLESE